MSCRGSWPCALVPYAVSRRSDLQCPTRVRVLHVSYGGFAVPAVRHTSLPRRKFRLFCHAAQGYDTGCAIHGVEGTHNAPRGRSSRPVCTRLQDLAYTLCVSTGTDRARISVSPVAARPPQTHRAVVVFPMAGRAPGGGSQ
ncbi:DUF5133 domain-containing protein [Streptomyces sp. NPDC059629]|uniref:DUF5133 domain-containing protein n=1 Tax=Streptomyces sp. NPDC059629 TaxID=3346889 RepID=UPI00369C02B0